MTQFERIDKTQIEQVRTDPAFSDIGRYTEDIVMESLARYVPPAFLYLNPILWENTDKQQAGWELTDVVFWHNTTLLLIECKGREIKKVEDLENQNKLKKWLDKRLSKAKDQVLKAENFLKKQRYFIGRQNDFAVLADFSKVEQIIPIIIVFEISDPFFRQSKIRERKKKYPDIEIYDLREFALASSMFSNVEDFLAYCQEKQKLTRKFPEFFTYEENLLKYYFSNGNKLDKLIEADSLGNVYKCYASGLPS